MRTREKKIQNPDTVCMRCGCPLLISEVCVQVQGQMINFETREVGGATFTFCHNCAEVMEEWANNGARGAVSRWNESNDDSVVYDH